MWLEIIAAVVVSALFSKKLMFAIKVGYTLQLYTFYSVVIRMWTIDEIQTQWTRHSAWFIRITLQKDPESVPVVKGRGVMLLGNHRNFCDFLIHDIITEHTANFLSRALVGVVFPFMAIISIYYDGCWFFVRGNTKRSFDDFFQWIDSKFEMHKTGRTNLVVYPEGHRNLKKEPLPLRSGMIKYAFSRKMPIQMYMCSGYDEVINEKKFSGSLGSAVAKYKVYPPIFTDQYMNFDSLMDELRESFTKRFHEIHNPNKS